MNTLALLEKLKQYEIVYFDMDGVLADLFPVVFAAYNAPPLEEMGLTEEQYQKALLKPIDDGLCVWLTPEGGVVAETVKEVSEFISSQPPKWWADLPALQDGLDLWDACQGHVETRVLSSMRCSPTSAMGKILWCQMHLGILKPHDYRVHLTVEKGECGKSGRLLIDDCVFNIAKFEEEGGTGLHWPDGVNAFLRGDNE